MLGARKGHLIAHNKPQRAVCVLGRLGCLLLLRWLCGAVLRIVGRSAVAHNARVGQRISTSGAHIRGVALNGVDVLAVNPFNNAGVLDIALGGAKKDLVTGQRGFGVQLPLVFVVFQRIRAARTGRCFGLAQQPERVSNTKSCDKAPVNEHITPCKAILFAVVKACIFGIKVVGILRVVVAACVRGFILQVGVGGLFLVSKLTDSNRKHLGGIAFCHDEKLLSQSFSTISAKRSATSAPYLSANLTRKRWAYLARFSFFDFHK